MLIKPVCLGVCGGQIGVAAAYLVGLIRDGDACEKEKTTLSTMKELIPSKMSPHVEQKPLL